MKKRVLQTAISAGVPFAAMMALFFYWKYGPFGAIAGLVSGIGFGICIAIFVERQRVGLEQKDQIFEDEAVLFQGPANHFKNGEGRGGWLVLTETKLAFRSHGKNLQNQPLDVYINEMSGLVRGILGRLIPRKLSVALKSGKRETFVVTQRGEWTRLLEERIQRAKGLR